MATVPLEDRKKQFHELIRRHLAELGFTKSGERYRLLLTPEATGILSASGVARRGPDGTALEIFSKAGVLYKPLDELLVDLKSLSKSPTLWHYGIHIGYLMPEHTYTPWLFEPGVDMTEGALEFVDCVERYVVPYLRALASPDALAEAVLTDTASPVHKFKAPAILYLLGRYEEALAMLTGTRQERPGDDKFKDFAERLAAKIEEARQG